MLQVHTTATEKRQRLRAALRAQRLLRFPGALSPLVAMLIETQGFDGVYISGAVVAADLGLPDIGLTTASEVLQRSHQIARATNLPAIVDIDTGFGEPAGVFRTVRELEQLGLAGCHLEDQTPLKRCGHLDHKTLVDTGAMVRRIEAAVAARLDENFLVIARTDARGVEGLDKTIERAKVYAKAGADMLFPEALHSEQEFVRLREAIDLPLLANMTEFGKSPLLDVKTLESLGYNLVIYPVTGLRLAMKAIEVGFAKLRDDGTQADLLTAMQTRAELYELLDYHSYDEFDSGIYDFEL